MLTSRPKREPLFKLSYTPIKQLHARSLSSLETLVGTTCVVKGWIRRAQGKKKRCFIHVHDGSTPETLQLIVSDEKVIEKIGAYLHVCATISATGTIVKSLGKGQVIEMQVTDCDIIGKILDPTTHLPGLPEVTMETMRDLHHLRSQFTPYQSIYRIRSKLMELIHKFFHQREIFNLDPCILTQGDAEGAGEAFSVTTLLKKDCDITKLPLKKGTTLIDFKQDFFELDSPVYLQVSSQLGLELMVPGMGGVYTTNPSMRAEHSKTKRHLACFTHLEFELPFITLDELMNFSEDLVYTCISGVLDECMLDMKMLDSTLSPGLIAKLESFIADKFARITYTDAIDLVEKYKDQILEEYGSEIKKLPVFGDDLGSCCEKFISEKITKRPTFVKCYPASLKAFYMRKILKPNILSDSSTDELKSEAKIDLTIVENYDLLIPGLGELIGSSLREQHYDRLVASIKAKCPEQLDAMNKYCAARLSASTESGGAGLGFERLVSLVTMNGGDIRHSSPFPCAWRECYD